MGLEGFEPPQSRTGTDHSDLAELQTQKGFHPILANYLLHYYRQYIV